MQTLEAFASVLLGAIGIMVLIALGHILIQRDKFFAGVESEAGKSTCDRLYFLLCALWILELQFFAATIWDLNRADQRHFPLEIRLPVAAIQTLIMSLGLHSGMGLLKQWARKSRSSNRPSKP